VREISIIMKWMVRVYIKQSSSPSEADVVHVSEVRCQRVRVLDLLKVIISFLIVITVKLNLDVNYLSPL
jgi:hypothetical protein